MRWFALLLLVTGCAAPHRAAVTSHEVRVYRGREDGLVSVEVWTDTEKGGGCFFLTDPSVTGLVAIHTNQTALGGGSQFMTGQASISVDPQTGAIIGAVGTAAGNVIGAAAKAAGVP
jgi:hypothetical protein